MKILALTKYDNSGASSRYRTYQFVKYFEEDEVHLTIRPFFNKSHIRKINAGKRSINLKIVRAILKRLVVVLSARKFDLVYIEKEIVPYFPPLLERFLKLRDVKFVLDYDDAIFHNYDSSKHLIVRTFFSSKIPKIISWASAIICGSNYLKDYCSRFNENCFVIPTVIPDKIISLSNKPTNKPFTIGWIGSFSTSKNLKIVYSALSKFCEKYGCEIKLIGINNTEFDIFKNIGAKKIIWSKENEEKELITFDVGLAPLIDTPFNYGKCAFKIIQYMSYGIATIASPIGANKDVVTDGVNGILIHQNDDWFNSLERLFLEKSFLKKLQVNSIDTFKQKFTIQSVIPKYLEIFNNIVNNEVLL